MAASCSSLAPTELEREHVHKVYDLIAPHFSHTRHHPWPQVTKFLDELAPGALVADVGCGNGKYLHVNPSICMFGADRSIPLMKTGASSDCNLLGCDALKVPLRTGAFDAALSIAVLHHISTEERRVALIRELARLVRVGGEILIVAWAFEQDERSKRRFEKQDVMVEWKLQQKYTQKKEGDDNDSNLHGRVDKEKRVSVSINALPPVAFLNDEVGLENDDDEDESDTSRITNSATHYARFEPGYKMHTLKECLRTENYAEATIALRSVLEISAPSSDSYKMMVLRVAEILKAAQQLKASIECVLSIYQVMPPPFSLTDGISIIARMYEQLESMDAARFWWRKLSSQSFSGHSELSKPHFLISETMADRFFDEELYIFAADFYNEVLKLTPKKEPSNRFRYRYLVSLLAFIGPQGPTMHNNFCKEVAWSMAQWFRRQNGNNISACYGDLHYYRLRLVFFTSFPAIYYAVFAWVDGPAGRIARWWRRQYVKLHPLPVDNTPSNSRVKCKAKKKLMRNTVLDQESRIKIHSFLRRKVASTPFPVLQAPSPTRKKGNGSNKKNSTAQYDLSHESRSRTEKAIDTSCKMDKNRFPNKVVSVLTNNTSSNEDKPRDVTTQCITKWSSSKRSINRHRCRMKPSKKLTNVEFSYSGSDDVEVQSMTQITSSNLLEVYPLQLPNTENFKEVCGRAPGFADLNLDEVRAFARLAHYRARVLTGENTRVDTLDVTKVKPQWLEDMERAIAFVEIHQQRILASGKVAVGGDSIAHISEVHTRLVLLITSLCRQYTRNYGETSFTRRLRVVTRRLIEWKFLRISEVIVALDEAKFLAIHEEKQRNLEFYHVHRDKK